MTPEEYGDSFDSEIAAILPVASARIPALAARVAGAGIEPRELTTRIAHDRLPIVTKDELIGLQAAEPPFGGVVAPGAAIRRIYQSPGPLYEPELDHADHWRFAQALEAADFGAESRVLNAFSYHLSPAGAMFEEAARALGATVVPGGIGNMELQIQVCVAVGVDSYTGLPSYLKTLLEKAESDGVVLGIERSFHTAEPLPPSLRAWLGERVPVVRQGYGTAEAGNLGFECELAEGLHVPLDALVEVCDLSTGEPLWDGTVGQVTATVLYPDYPIVRLGTGDLSAYLTDPCECGRPEPRIKGWMGRAGDAVKVRGMFLHPRHVEQVMARITGVTAYRFVVERAEHRDELRCEIVTAPGEDQKDVAKRIADAVRAGLRFKAAVEVVDELETDDGPIVDHRVWD
jgi:phenylacetate-CoA ligase